MDEIWERAVQTALDGVSDCASARTLTLDGAVKCVHGRLPPPSLLEKFHNLQHLSIANTGVSSLEQFPRLLNLQKLILSDNRIANGLEYLVEAGLDSLRDLDLSNNRIQSIEDLAPLAGLRLVSLDLYECPVTRVKDYRARVFGLIKSLKYLDKMDAEGNERPESDDEDDEEDEEDEDPGSGEIDGEDRSCGLNSGHSSGGEGIVDVDEDEESDAEEETEIPGRRENGSHHQSNGFRVAVAGEEDAREEDLEEEGDDDDNESAEEIFEEGEDEDVVEVHEIEDSDDEDDEEYDEDDEDEEEEVDNEDVDFSEPAGAEGLKSTEGEIDAHEQGEEDDGDEDDNGMTGEDEQGLDEDCDFEEDAADEEEEDNGAGYLVQRVVQDVEDVEEEDEDDDEDEDEEDDDEEDDLGEVQVMQRPCSPQPKRKREDDSGDDDDDDEDDEGSGRSSKKMQVLGRSVIEERRTGKEQMKIDVCEMNEVAVEDIQMAVIYERVVFHRQHVQTLSFAPNAVVYSVVNQYELCCQVRKWRGLDSYVYTVLRGNEAIYSITENILELLTWTIRKIEQNIRSQQIQIPHILHTTNKEYKSIFDLSQ
ncbi:uncharacterized protein [Phyllobates terribilis]|uniref:uncharacterized protein n=1 Tax=Phyllobates terribilis TaxID=111132 RepID=UPI003CCA71F6